RDKLVNAVQTCALPIFRCWQETNRLRPVRNRASTDGPPTPAALRGDRAALRRDATSSGPNRKQFQDANSCPEWRRLRRGILPTRSEERRVGREYRVRL